MGRLVRKSMAVVKLVVDDNCSQLVHDSPVDTLRERLQYLLDNFWNGDQADMNRDCGLVRGHIGQILDRLQASPKGDIAGKTAARIANKAEVELRWLITGEGPMLLGKSPSDKRGTFVSAAKTSKFKDLDLTAEQCRLAECSLAEGATMQDISSVVEAMRSAQKEVSMISPGIFYDAIKLQRDTRLGPMHALFRSERSLRLVRESSTGEPTEKEFPKPEKTVEGMDAKGLQRKKEREENDTVKGGDGEN